MEGESHSSLWSKLGSLVSGKSSEDHLEQAIREAQEDGELKAEESSMLLSILSLDELQAQDIMTPRIDVTAFDIDDEERLLELVSDTAQFSRLPVFEDSIDNIVGILYAKDIFEHMNEDFEQLKVKTLIRNAYYIPETKKVDDLLEELRMKKVHMAIILDEYGGTSGLVTIEDLLEEIIGDIQDEYDAEEDLIVMHSDTVLVADARTPIHDVEEAFDIELDEEILDDSEADTIGGIAFEHLGGIPEKGDEVTVDRFHIRVVEVQGRRIAKVEVTLLPSAEQDDDNDE